MFSCHYYGIFILCKKGRKKPQLSDILIKSSLGFALGSKQEVCKISLRSIKDLEYPYYHLFSILEVKTTIYCHIYVSIYYKLCLDHQNRSSSLGGITATKKRRNRNLWYWTENFDEESHFLDSWFLFRPVISYIKSFSIVGWLELKEQTTNKFAIKWKSCVCFFSNIVHKFCNIKASPMM